MRGCLVGVGKGCLEDTSVYISKKIKGALFGILVSSQVAPFGGNNTVHLSKVLQLEYVIHQNLMCIFMQNQTLTLFKSKFNPILFLFFLSPYLLSVFVVPTTS